MTLKLAKRADIVELAREFGNRKETSWEAAALLVGLCAEIEKLRGVLGPIVHEYEQTYDVDVQGDHWTQAAQIPVEVMERAKALLPRERKHVESAACWCHPTLSYTNAETGVQQWVHHEQN